MRSPFVALAVAGLLLLAANAHKLHEGAGENGRSGHHAIKALDGALSPAGLSGSGCLRSPPVASHAAASSMSHAEGLPRALLAPGRGQEPFILEPAGGGGSSRDKDSKRKASTRKASVSQGSSSNRDSNRDTVRDRKSSRDSQPDKKVVKEVAKKAPSVEPDNKPVVKEVARKEPNSRQEKPASAEPQAALKTTPKADKDHADDKKVSPQHTSDKKDHGGGCDKTKNPDCDKPQEPPKPCDKDNKPGCKPGCDWDKDPSCRWPIRIIRRRDNDDDFDDDDDTGGVQLRTFGEEDKDGNNNDKDRSKDRDDECGCLKDTWTKLNIDGRVQCPCCICWRPSDGKERCPCPEYH